MTTVIYKKGLFGTERKVGVCKDGVIYRGYGENKTKIGTYKTTTGEVYSCEINDIGKEIHILRGSYDDSRGHIYLGHRDSIPRTATWRTKYTRGIRGEYRNGCIYRPDGCIFSEGLVGFYSGPEGGAAATALLMLFMGIRG